MRSRAAYLKRSTRSWAARADPAPDTVSTDGKVYTFNEQATEFVDPAGHDLSRVVPTWRCNVASPECTAAVAFYHRLRWAPWIARIETFPGSQRC